MMKPFGNACLRIITLCILLTCVKMISYAQIYDQLKVINTDSLKRLLPLQNAGEQIKTCFRIIDGYFVTNPDSCYKYALLAGTMAETYDNDSLKTEARLYLGKACYFKGFYDQSIHHYLAARTYFNSSKNQRKILLIDELLVFAYYYADNLDATKAQLEIIKSHLGNMPDSAYLAHFIIGFGYFYRYLEDYEQAIPYFLQYNELSKVFPLPRAALALSNGHLGYCYERTGNYDEAIRCYREDIRISEALNFSTRSYLLLGSVYERMDSLDKAASFYHKAISFYEAFGNVYFVSLSSLGLGNVFMKQGIYNQALPALSNALKSAQWMFTNKLLYRTLNTEVRSFYTTLQIVDKYKEDIALKIMADIHFELYRLYDAQANTRKALDEYIQYHQTLEQLNSHNQLAAIEEIKNRYESEQKEQKISILTQANELSNLQLKNSRIILFTLGGLLALAILIAILLVRMIRIRSEQRAAVLEQKLLRSQMNPHFIFNALSNITNLVEKQDNANASRYLTRFARLVRHILESTREDFIILDDELKNLENYLELQQLRLHNKFSYSITLEDGIDPESIRILPMLIQPFVENAIEHGIRHKEGKGHIYIRMRRAQNCTIFEVEDDGIGRQKAKEILMKQDPKYKSLATIITRERIAALNRRSKKKITLEIIDIMDEEGKAKGTVVRFGIPV
jgi:tetratricopeptide (TPR) repeat protein